MKIEMRFADVAAKRVGSMIGHISYFANVEMPGEMSAWQTVDMHRRKPATKRSRWRRHRKTASTIIRPHSLKEVLRSKKYQQRLGRRLRAKRKKPLADFIQPRRSTRPILRDSLYQKFVERLERAMDETLVWD